MAQKDAKTIKDELARPFAPEDLEWRIQYANEKTNRGIVVPYVTNRAIQARLDEVVGIAGWYNDYKPWHGATRRRRRSAASPSILRSGADSSPNGTARRTRILSL